MMKSPRAKKSSENYLIDLNDYDIIRNINTGGFGAINLVQNKKNGKEYAAKTNLIPNKSQNKLFISREVRILIHIQHLTIIQFRGFSYVDFNGNKNITILMDYMKEGSLANLIDLESKSLLPSNYDNTNRQIILVGIARGMMLLHNRCVIHRDLKPENILLDSDFRPRITDFGLSKFFDPHHSMTMSMANTGTAAYMAPEVINSDHFNTKADVYAFGILMYEVIGGKRAYEDLLHGKKRLNEFQLKMKVIEGLRPEFDFPIKKGLKKMIEKCWSKDPKERPTFEEIFKKLSLSNEDYFLEFEENHEEPKITDNDDDDEDEDDDDVFSKRFCLEGVDEGKLLDYVDEIKKDHSADDIQKEELLNVIDVLNTKIKKMDETISEKAAEISSLKAQLSKVAEMEKTIKNQAAKISSLEAILSGTSGSSSSGVDNVARSQISSIQQKLGNLFRIEESLKGPGILSTLNGMQKTPFDKLFIASQSSCDIYSLLVPDTEDILGTPNDGNFYFEIELETSIEINGVRVFTATWDFPKSFDIAVDGKTVNSVKEAKDLNGKFKDMTFNFSPVQCKKVRFTQTGPNWDKGTNYLHIKGFELLSTEEKYSKGVFATLVGQSENKDPHKCPVIISATYCDYSKFYTLNPPCNVYTLNKNNSWFQVEMTKGMAVLTGFRLERTDPNKLRSYKVICADDSNKLESSWITLIEIEEKTENEHKQLDIYKFLHPSPPVRFVRLVSTGQTWSNNLEFKFLHFDLFGVYF